MKRDLARRLGWLFAAGFLLTLAPRTVQADSCTFVLGFAQLAALDPVQIGQCVDDQRFDADRAQALQHTTTGLLVWDKASNESSFTNGRETLVLTRYGLAARTNDQRFWFEPNPDGLPTVYGNAVVDVSVEQGGTGAVVTDFTLAQSVPLQVSLRGGGFNPGEPIAIDWTFTPYYNLPNASGQAYHVDRRACPDIRLPGSTETADTAGSYAATLTAPGALPPYGLATVTATGAASGAAATAYIARVGSELTGILPPDCTRNDPVRPRPSGVPAPARLDATNRCHTGGLALSRGVGQGAAGTIYDIFELQNVTIEPCWLYGYVGAQLYDSLGRPLAAEVTREASDGLQGPSLFVLAQGERAQFTFAWRDNPYPGEVCPSVSSIRVTPPDEYQSLLLTASGAELMRPCGGVLRAGAVQPE